MAKWVHSEREQAELNLVHVESCYWIDRDGHYWFNDETQVDMCGPFDTFEACNRACTEYAATI